MALNFKPMTEQEVAASGLAPEGVYDFDVIDSKDRISKSGNAMIEVKLGVYDGEAVRWHVYDYLLEAMPGKLRHFCDSVDLLKQYDAGTLSATDCKGRSGKVKLVIDNRDPAYPPKNAVKDYVVRKAKAAPSDDDLPPF